MFTARADPADFEAALRHLQPRHHLQYLRRDEQEGATEPPPGFERTAFLDVPAMRKPNLEVELIADEEALDNAELKHRVLKRLANVPGAEILVVSHRVLIRELTNEDVDNCSVVSCTLEQGSIENVKVEVCSREGEGGEEGKV